MKYFNTFWAFILAACLSFSTLADPPSDTADDAILDDLETTITATVEESGTDEDGEYVIVRLVKKGAAWTTDLYRAANEKWDTLHGADEATPTDVSETSPEESVVEG